MFYSSQSSRVLETTSIHIENGYIHSYIPKYLCQQSSISIKTQERWIIFNKNNLVAVVFSIA